MSLGIGFCQECEVCKTVEVSKTAEIASSFFYKTIKKGLSRETFIKIVFYKVNSLHAILPLADIFPEIKPWLIFG